MPQKRWLALMLPLTVALLGAALATPADDAARFSHRRHLTLDGIRCETCHAPVLASSSSRDSNLPGEKVCLGCHPALRGVAQFLEAHAPAPRSYRFDHRLHLGFGNVAAALRAAIDGGRYLGRPDDLRGRLDGADRCQACHRGVTEVDLAGPGNLPRMADCLVCHTRIDPPFSCGYCHTEGAALRPASHSAVFADAHSSARGVPDKSGCKVCHGVRFTCMGCH